jgi:hypothetical protein
MPKPIRVNIKLKNNILMTLREAAGLSTVQVAEKAQMPYYAYIALESLSKSPLRKDGGWTVPALKLSAYWKMLPEDLFPEVLFRIQKTKGSFEIDEKGVDHLMKTQRNTLPLLPEELPDRVIEMREAKRDLETAIRLAKERQQWPSATFDRDVKIFKMYHEVEDGDFESVMDIAKQFGISHSRVQQVVAKYERRLRHQLNWMRKDEEARVAGRKDDISTQKNK